MRNLLTCLTVTLVSGATFATTWTVDDDGKADFNYIQGALQIAVDGDEILVMPGTYTGTGATIVNTLGKAVWLHSSGGPEVTIIDCEGARRGIQFVNNETSNTIVEGLTIRGGYSDNAAGGILIDGSNPTMLNCIVTNCYAVRSGGGVLIDLGNPSFTDCIFKNNSSGGTPASPDNGGGVYCNNSFAIFTNCSFINNQTEDAGGGMFNHHGSLVLSSCTFKDNSASNGGGLGNIDSENTVIADSIFCGNSPDQIDGGYTDGGGNTFGEFCWLDCNNNGVDDLVDIANQTSFDCDQNGVPDECQPDCDGDGWIDACETEGDCDNDGIPDNCETDCNGNGLPDDCDIIYGISQDCNGNGIPDECDLTNGGQVPEGAVQWTIEEGGNGNWYEVISLDQLNIETEADMLEFAESLGVSLASISSADEDAFVRSLAAAVTSDTALLGGFEASNGVFIWLDGTPFVYTNWDDGQPDGNSTGEYIAYYDISNFDAWHDVTFTDGTVTHFIIEWSEIFDCNGDGLIDSCQIDDDPSLDCNDNAILDSCELAEGVPSEGAIQWTIEEGGNGHWYQVIATSDGYHPTWNESRVFAQDLGGDMVTFETESELDFCRANLTQPTETTNNGAWIGLYQEPGSSEPAGDWYWISGLAASMDWGWVSGEPNDNGGEDKALINLSNNNSSTWFLYYDYNGNNDNRNYFIEWDESSFSFSTDCNANGIPDECDIADGTSTDVNGNDIPDECEVDCNGNSVPDHWDIKTGESQDCNDNGIPDDCDIEDGTSADVNSNGIPDECEDDCNGNGVPDSWDIETGAAIDCNGNGIPDSCDVAAGCDADCNLNGVPDSCDLASGTSEDINMNNVPDDCECIADITGDGVVNIHDLLALIGYWGSPGPLGDFNADGIVKIHDLLILIASWGECTNIICNDDPPIGAVQWTIEDGGNGHWYMAVSTGSDDINWEDAKIDAMLSGGHLVSFSDIDEFEFIKSNIANDISLWTVSSGGDGDCLCSGPWVGASNQGEGITQVDGTAWPFADQTYPWHPGNPDNCCPSIVGFFDYYGPRSLQDHPSDTTDLPNSYIIEWSN